MLANINRRNRVICFSGVDGSGKSAHARRLFNELEAAGVKCQYKWLRYPHFLALVPLALYEFRTSKARSSPGIVQQQSFMKSQVRANRLIVETWAFILFLDSFLSMARNVYLPVLFRHTLILDRFVVDTLLDIALGLKREELVFGITGKLFLKLIPRSSTIFVFDVEEGLATYRKGPLEEAYFSRKRALYRRLSQMYNWNVISTEAPFPEVHDKVLRIVTKASLG
jgi:thymidylate kinase